MDVNAANTTKILNSRNLCTAWAAFARVRNSNAHGIWQTSSPIQICPNELEMSLSSAFGDQSKTKKYRKRK